jgi:hypothetical protein
MAAQNPPMDADTGPFFCLSASICVNLRAIPDFVAAGRVGPFAPLCGNPQSAHDTLKELVYLMIPTRKSGFTRLGCAFTGLFFGKSSQPPLHEHLTHKWQPFQ